MNPAKTYILPPAAAPKISSAGSGNGASFSHLSCCAKSEGAAAPVETSARTNENKNDPEIFPAIFCGDVMIELQRDSDRRYYTTDLAAPHGCCGDVSALLPFLA